MLPFKKNPPMTLPSMTDLVEAPGNWAAAYCKPRQEKALAWDLYRAEVPYFLPMVSRETFSGGRRRRNLYPMFKSYVFFAGDDRERLLAQKTNRVLHLVDIHPVSQTTFRNEINSLKQTLATDPEDLELYPQLVSGRRVLVIAGAMKGVEGTILNAENPAKLWIGITLMGAGAVVQVHADFLEPLSDQADSVASGLIELPVGGGKHVTAMSAGSSE